MKYLGIDIGSTYIKSIVLDPAAGEAIPVHSVPTPKKRADSNVRVFEIPADEIVAAVRQELNSFSDSLDASGSPEKDAGLLLSVQMHGFVYVTPGREPMYVSWQDMRCLDPAAVSGETWLQRMIRTVPAADMQDFGVYFKPSLGVCNLFAMLMEHPEIPKDGTLYTLGSYVLSTLSGSPDLNMTHATSAAPLGIVNVREGRMDPAVLNRFGLGAIRLPELAGETDCIGMITVNHHTIRLYPDFGDGQVAVFGCSPKEGEIVANIATAAQVLRTGTDFLPGDYEIRPFFGGRYLYTISNMPGGRNLDVLVQFFKHTAETLTGRQVSDTDVWTLLHKEEAPRGRILGVDANFYENPHFPDGGSITGIDQNNLTMRNIFLGACRNMAEVIWRFMKQLGIPEEQIYGIICAGGVSWKTPELCEAIGRVSGLPWVLSPVRDECAAGLLELARMI